MKKPEYAKIWISFSYYNGAWSLYAYQSRPNINTSTKFYQVEIPVPEELLIEQLPNQEKIKQPQRED